jgi:hypothetical protein
VDARPYLTSAEVCQLLGISSESLRTHRERLGLPHIPLAKGYRYKRESVIAWMDACEQAIVPERKRRESSRRRQVGPRAARPLVGAKPMKVSWD